MNHEPFVGNANAMKPWISDLYHTLGAWNAQEIGVYPRIRYTALSWLSVLFTYTSNLRIQFRLTLLTKLSRGLVEWLSAKPLKQRKMHFDKNKDRGKTKEKHKPRRVSLQLDPHLVFSP